MKKLLLLCLMSLAYSLSMLAQSSESESNNTWQQANSLPIGTSVTGRLNKEDVDWYKIVVPDEGILSFTQTAETTLRLGRLLVYTLGSDGELHSRDSKDMDGYNKEVTVEYSINDIAPGTYYIEQKHYDGEGSYRLTCSFSPNKYGADHAGNDSYDKAEPLTSGKSTEGRLGYYYLNDKDVADWYKIVVPDEGSITFTQTTETTLRLGRLYVYTLGNDGELHSRDSKDMDAYNNDTTTMFTLNDIAPGTYYIEQKQYDGYGGYRLTYTFTPNSHGADNADNDSYDKATTLEDGILQQGRLGYYYYNDQDVVDWYKIVVPSASEAVFSQTTETTLRLGRLYIYALDGDGRLLSRDSKDMDAYNKDTTIVFTISDLAPGTYYIEQKHYDGYGGYRLNYQLRPNNYGRDRHDNGTFEKRIKLEKGKLINNTLGYYYDNNINNEDWYELETIAREQIDITIMPDTSRSLNLGIAYIYKYEGVNSNGSPILKEVTSARLERSTGTLSYIDKSAEPSVYIVRVKRYSGYGGYSICYGAPDGDHSEISSHDISVMTGGRNTVRKGVPCENTITISNLSDRPSDFFMLAVVPTDDIHIIGFRMPVGNSSEYLPAEDVTIPGESTCLFFVPRLEPWESYTFTMISEGVGDIAYTRENMVIPAAGPKKIFFTGTAITIAAVGAFVKTAATGLAVGAAVDWVSKKAGDAIFPADSQDAQQYARLMGTTTKELGIRSSWDSPTVYTAKSVLSTATTEYTKKVVPKTGTVLDVAGNVITAMSNIIPNLRRRIWYWIYKDLGYFDNEKIDVIDGKNAVTDVVSSWDPNEMVGPAGVGDNHYIGKTETVNYVIMFENKAEAGAPAYRVRISDELDENVFDINSVKFGNTSHDGIGYNWKMTREGNRLSWDIEGIELPPNVNAPEGEGYVSFSVNLKPGLTDGTRIKNKATIIFDKNTPIETNEYVNTLDLQAPVTTMSRARILQDGSIRISCQSDDEGAGIEYYLLFAAKESGEYEYQGQYFSATMDCTVEGDPANYSFYVLAADAVGNVEQTAPQAVTPTGIQAPSAGRVPDFKVYSTDGRYIGKSLSGLAKGIYIINGKKVIIK